MNVHLMHESRDFELEPRHQTRKPPSPSAHEEALRQDLALDTILRVMAADNEFLFAVARRALIESGANGIATIRYRQDVLKDCLQNPAVVREIYGVAVEAIDKNRKLFYRSYSRFPRSILYESVEALQVFFGLLAKLRAIADDHAAQFASAGFLNLFGMLR